MASEDGGGEDAATPGVSLAVMALNDTKAGMTGLDKNKINAIIEEASKGSKFYAAKIKSQERIDAQLQKIKSDLAKITEDQLKRAEKDMDALAAHYRESRDLSRTIVHVDMDMYYAAVEMLDYPKLKSVPMAVGGMGMLSTSNYLARKFGVRAGMPGFIGKKLCPELVLVKPNYKRYQEMSEVVRNVFREYDPNFSPMSLDEAYLDLTDYLSTAGLTDPQTTVAEIRAKIEERTQLTASAGIAPNARLAKVCSDLNKPNGQYFLKPNLEEVDAFVRGLAIRKVGGIGNVTEQMLKAVGVENCADLYEKRGRLKILFSEVSSTGFLRIALGIGATRLSDWTDRERKSISNERTFRDTSDPGELFEFLKHLSHELAADLEKESREGRAVTVKIKTHNFKIKTKVLNLLEFTSDAAVIESAAKKILRQLMDSAEEKPLKLRLMGVRMSEFRNEESLDEGHGTTGNARQSTIDSFLRRKDQPSSSEEKHVCPPTSSVRRQTFECPICGHEIQATSEHAFNAHLDSCLKHQVSENESLPGDENEMTVIPMETKQNLEQIEIAEGPESACSASTTLSPIHVSTADGVDAESSVLTTSALETLENERPNDCTPVSCPVCHKRIIIQPSEIHGKELVINKHIDECLNKEQISSMLSSSASCSASSSGKVTSSKRKSNDLPVSVGKKKKIEVRRDIKSYFDKR